MRDQSHLETEALGLYAIIDEESVLIRAIVHLCSVSM